MKSVLDFLFCCLKLIIINILHLKVLHPNVLLTVTGYSNNVSLRTATQEFGGKTNIDQLMNSGDTNVWRRGELFDVNMGRAFMST